MPGPWKCCIVGLLFLARLSQLATAQVVGSSARNSGESDFFEQHVRPVLVLHCVKCHGPQKSESGLRLDQRVRAMQGGHSGPAIVPGEPKQSLLVKAIRRQGDVAMPPDVRLEEHEINSIVRWIEHGASWPEGQELGPQGPQLRSGPISQKERSFWALQPIVDYPLPPADDSAAPRNGIDHFVNARLSKHGLTMRGPADKRTLLRRATYDLTGFPPTSDEIEAFLADDSPQAFERVVDRLLHGRAYAERWGRHWLDVVRYADTAGETADYPTPLAYKYRNWVIEAFQLDKPYDVFIREQIAGDILGERFAQDSLPESASDESASDESGTDGSGTDLRRAAQGQNDEQEDRLELYCDCVTATGFIAISRRFGFDVEKWHTLTIQDTLDTLGQAVLGLTIGCARCHDHKYDPINVADYYAWYGILDSTRYSFPGSEQKKRPYDLLPALPPRHAASAKAQFDQQLAQLESEIKRLEKTQRDLSTNSPDQRPSQLQPSHLQSSQQAGEEVKSARSGSEAAAIGLRLAEITRQRGQLQRVGPYPQIYGAAESSEPHDARVQIRGDRLKLGPEVPRKNLEILGNDLLPPGAGSGRLALADWLTRPSNPLTARVMVNRIWQQHFGRGIVGSENDFGARGDLPTHPELLDWLAARFVASGWSVKAMHRLIMDSAAYRQSSDYDMQATMVDPESRLLWRFNRRRLSAEEIRDAMLIVSGELDFSIGGEHPFPPEDKWGFTQHAPFYGDYVTNRRSVYLMQQRLKRHPFLSLFDGPDPNASTARRQLTTVPTQTLYLMNSEFVHRCSASLARRLCEYSNVPDQRVNYAHLLALGRPADPAEVGEVLAFFREHRRASSDASGEPPGPNELEAWTALCRTLITRNEFLFVD